MKNSIIFLFLIALLALLPACQSAPASGGKISFMVFGEPAELAAYQRLVDTFQQEHPEIQVEVIQVPGQSDYRKRMAADIAAGSPADVVLVNYRRQAAFASAGALTPLDDYLAKSTTLKEADFYPQSFAAFKWDGKQVCIPQNISSLVIYYNKALFDQAGVAYPAPGWTWADFLSAAQALTKDLNGDGTNEQFGAGIDPELIRIAPFVWQAGSDLVDDDANPTTLMLDTSEALDAGKFFMELQTAHHVVPNAEQEAAEASESRFLNGRTAMYFNSRRVVPTIREAAKFDWDVAALPQEKTAATILHADGYCLPSASKNKDAAWVFIEFANSAEGQTILAQTGRTVPSLISIAESPVFLDPSNKPAHSQVFLDVIPTMRVLPLHPAWADIEDTATQEITRGFYGETDPYDAMLRAVQRTRDYFTGK